MAWGDDRYGLWADLEANGVIQRMRWIEPGEFWMGSPDDERGRYDREGPRHRVRLREGLWLADTVCTQALWLAVIGGKNPARFTDDPNNPVEQVSWDDALGFLEKLGASHTEGTEAVFPTEAQWEYACRAGTDTALSFGSTIDNRWVNFSGKWDLNDKKPTLGESRNKTVPVKSLPPNPWGLYEMHGNVWEWCADNLRPYGDVEAGTVSEDPQGLAEPGPEAPCAVRGGSWFYYAGDVRSAFRLALPRDARNNGLGFRLALRSSSSSPVGAERQAPEAPPVLAPRPEGMGPAARRDAGPRKRSS